jgi:hypothetical protein
MKKIWKNYSYAIILILLSLMASIIIKINLPSTDQYKTITVMDGESLWEISQKYKSEHGLTETQFIKWVETYNGISGDHIVSGADLVLPIVDGSLESNDGEEVHELASN